MTDIPNMRNETKNQSAVASFVLATPAQSTVKGLALKALVVAYIALIGLLMFPTGGSAQALQESTRTPQPTPVPTTLPDDSEVLPPLFEQLTANRLRLEKLSDQAMDALKNPDAFNVEVLKTISVYTREIKALRNKVMMTSLRFVSIEARRTTVSPAFQAYVRYANAVLRLIMVQTEVNQQHIAMTRMKTVDKAAKAKLETLKKRAELQQKRMVEEHTALDRAMVEFAILTNVELVRLRAEPRTIIVASNNEMAIRLDKGRYRIWVAKIPGAAFTLSLQSVKDSNSIRLPADGQILEIPVGEYRISADEGSVWWVVGFDPDV